MRLLSHKNHICKTLRSRLSRLIGGCFSIRSDRLQAHIIDCPRCRQRLSGYNRLALGLTLMKSQRPPRDLLGRANSQAIGVLQRSLRQTPQAERLRQKRPQPGIRVIMNRYAKAISNAAACLAVLLLIRTGVLSGMETFQTEGEKALRQYYVQNLGQDGADEIFKIS